MFPASQLGGDTDMLSQLRSGALEMQLIPALVLSTLVPVSSIDGIGFAFPDYDAVWKAMDGELGAFVRNGGRPMATRPGPCWSRRPAS